MTPPANPEQMKAFVVGISGGFMLGATLTMLVGAIRPMPKHPLILAARDLAASARRTISVVQGKRTWYAILTELAVHADAVEKALEEQ